VGTVTGGMNLNTSFKGNSTVALNIIKGKRDTDDNIIIISAEIRYAKIKKRTIKKYACMC
jgi:hypothetical protein